MPTSGDLDCFVQRVWQLGRDHARDSLPWRYVDDAYAVYVSEVMLQQTQVSRVESYWPRWMKAFPTIDALASASQGDVLERWQGLGYNRRGLAMLKAARICQQNHASRMPDTHDALVALPGIGPATAAGILAFAYQKPAIYIETNVRAVFIHEFFGPGAGPVSDSQIRPLVEATLVRDDPRGWYYALLDYGAYLKRTLPNPTRRSAHYTRQGAFEGSRRQKRSFILREVLDSSGVSAEEVKRLLDESERQAGRAGVDDDLFADIVGQMEREGFFTVEDGLIRTADG